MLAPHSLHPSDRTLNDYGLGKLDDETASTVHEHLEVCVDCRQRVAGFTPDSFLGRFREGQKPTFQSAPEGWLENGTVSMMQGRPESSPPPTDTLPPGLADHPDYEIRRELGRGGMGVVYLAHNAMMGRDEVLKVMGRHIMERPGVLERFQREIRAVAKLRHPNIVAAYHAFRIEGGLVFSMEYVEGLDLARLVKAKGPLSVAHAAYFAHHAALGLQHAHERGLIHRDIKPHNLMLTHDGKARLVKVLDFGLAKANREEKVDGGLTSEGQALGTPDYIAPEQIVNALDVDIRADIYSLGGTLFYLLTGRPPFQATSLYDIYQAHMSRDAEPLNMLRPEVPAELAALVAKMMAKEPGRRFQTPAEVAEALRPFFQKNAARPKSEVSIAGQHGVNRDEVVLEPQPAVRPVTSQDRAPRPKKTPEASQGEGLWEALIEDGDPEALESPEAAFAIRRQETPRPFTPAKVAGLILAAFLVAFGITICIIKSKREKVIVINPTQGEDRTIGAEIGKDASDGRDAMLGSIPVVERVPAERSPGTLESTEGRAGVFPSGNTAPPRVPGIKKPGLRNGLVAYYGFDDGNAFDLSGNGHQGQLSGEPSSLPGVADEGVFNSDAARPITVTIPVSIGPKRMPQITMGGWFNTRRANTWSTMISHDNGPYDRTLAIENRGNKDGRFQWSTTTGRGVIGMTDVIAGKWTFVAMRHDQNSGRLTLDVDDRRKTIPDAKFTPGYLETTIGRNPGYGGNFNGLADNIFLYDRVLDDGEIAAIRTRGRVAILGPEDADRSPGDHPAVGKAAGTPLSLLNAQILTDWSAWGEKGPLDETESRRIWSFKDGILHGRDGVSHLFSPRGDHQNFRLRAEVKINDGGNSGIFFRTVKIGGFPEGYEAQVNCTLGDVSRTGSLYGMVNIRKSAIPPDTWFTMEVEAIGDRIRIWVDGKPQVDFVDRNRTYSRGHFAIQVRNKETHVQVRALEVTELDASGAAVVAR